MDEKSPYKLWGESIREVGILFLVFGPLDTLLRREYGTERDWLIAGGVAIFGLLLIIEGIIMEGDT